MMTREEMCEKIADEIVQGVAILVSGNRQPHMSGDPTARLLPHQRRDLASAAKAVADRILALMPDPALAEIGRLAVACEAEARNFDGDSNQEYENFCKAINAYFTSDHPPPRERGPGAGTDGAGR